MKVPSHPNPFVNFEAICNLSNYQQSPDDIIKEVQNWTLKGLSEPPFYGKNDINSFVSSQIQKGSTFHKNIVIVLKTILENTPDLWNSEEFWKKHLANWILLNYQKIPKAQVGLYSGFWECWIQKSHPYEWKEAFTTHSKHSFWKTLQQDRDKIGLISSLNADSPHAFKWLFAHLIAQNWSVVDELIHKGVRFNPLVSENIKSNFDSDLYEFLYSNMHVTKQMQSNEERWDAPLAKAWTILLDLGVPSLSSTQKPVKSSFLVAKLELERGGMRDEHALYNWLHLSSLTLPIQENIWSFLKPYGIHLEHLKTSLLNRWLTQQSYHPERVKKAISTLTQNSFSFQESLNEKKETFRHLLPYCLDKEMFDMASQIGLPTFEALNDFNQNHPLGYLISLSQKKKRNEMIQAYWSYLKENNQETKALFFQNQEEQTFLHLACYQADLALADWFIKLGLSVHSMDSQGNTPIHFLIYNLTIQENSVSSLSDFFLSPSLDSFDWFQKNHTGYSALMILKNKIKRIRISNTTETELIRLVQVLEQKQKLKALPLANPSKKLNRI